MSVQTERSEGVMAFMPFYFERYCWTTRGWPVEARWAYLMLLCEQYTAGHLPADPKVLERLSPGTAEHWDLIEPKIPLGPDGLRRNQRCTEHRSKSIDIAKARKEAARLAAAAKYGRKPNGCVTDASRMPDGCVTDASRIPSGSGSETGSGSVIGNAERSETHTLTADGGEPVSVQAETKQRRKPLGTDADFELWWRTYPRRVGKTKARAAWLKALPAVKTYAQVIDEAVAEVMQEAVAAYVADPETKKLEPQYIPHPATWLNEGRYIDILERLDAR